MTEAATDARSWRGVRTIEIQATALYRFGVLNRADRSLTRVTSWMERVEGNCKKAEAARDSRRERSGARGGERKSELDCRSKLRRQRKRWRACGWPGRLDHDDASCDADFTVTRCFL